MSTSSRFHRTASALALAAMLSACASTGTRGGLARASDYRVKSVDVGMATKALAALNSNDFVHAIDFAERAVAQSPRDAGFRSLLGNAYFGAGRFASAEQAYRDSLALYQAQPQVMLKLALVKLSLGKTAEALELIDYARPSLDPADYGLALALAGRPGDAIPVLREAAGAANSDPRVRQNLALALALGGDWVNARVVAAQDVAPNELDARIQQWMQLASNHSRPQQVAALTGVTPAASDPGQPVRLALAAPVDQGTALAAAQPAPAPVHAPAPVAAPAPMAASAPASPPASPPAPVADQAVVFAPPPPPPVEVTAQPPLVVASAEVATPAPQAGSITVKLPEARPVAPAVPAIAAAQPTVVAPAPASADFPYVEVKKRLAKRNAPRALAAAAALADRLRPVARPAALRLGNAGVVVQLGAFGSSSSVARAWNIAARKYVGVSRYVPVSARFTGPRGSFYRLSVRGFASPAEAARLCGAIRRSGGACFVRNVAGDRPVDIAAR